MRARGSWAPLIVVLAAAAHLVSGSASAKDRYAPPPATQTTPDYVLGPGDKIRVITFGEESLTGTFLVGATGRVSLPLIGEVEAGGRTTGQVAAEMSRMLADGFLKDPRVSIEVVDFRPYYILGEVNKPGLYPYTDASPSMAPWRRRADSPIAPIRTRCSSDRCRATRNARCR